MEKPRYWFKRRRYGYGWTPVTRQGWGIVIVFLVFVIGTTPLLAGAPKNTLTTSVVTYLACILIVLAMLITVSYHKGPKPKWRWGSKPTDNPDEDY